MPTGYTADIKKGITFSQFALRCSRAFGALIHMREEPLDAPIPDDINEDSYYKKELDKANANLISLRSMPDKEAEKRANEDYEMELANYKKTLLDIQDTQAKYEAMLQEVKNWTPPTSDHVGLKEFMAEQIESSIKFDCNHDWLTPPIKLSGTEWKMKKIEDAEYDIERHSKYYAEEKERNAGRNNWIKSLKNSLSSPQPSMTEQTNESP
jgi:hypothetical protein